MAINSVLSDGVSLPNENRRFNWVASSTVDLSAHDSIAAAKSTKSNLNSNILVSDDNARREQSQACVGASMLLLQALLLYPELLRMLGYPFVLDYWKPWLPWLCLVFFAHNVYTDHNSCMKRDMLMKEIPFLRNLNTYDFIICLSFAARTTSTKICENFILCLSFTVRNTMSQVILIIGFICFVFDLSVAVKCSIGCFCIIMIERQATNQKWNKWNHFVCRSLIIKILLYGLSCHQLSTEPLVEKALDSSGPALIRWQGVFQHDWFVAATARRERTPALNKLCAIYVDKNAILWKAPQVLVAVF